jgi:hypothetical protein
MLLLVGMVELYQECGELFESDPKCQLEIRVPIDQVLEVVNQPLMRFALKGDLTLNAIYKAIVGL